MTLLVNSRRLVRTLTACLSLLMATGPAAGDETASSTSDEGPVLIALAPSKPKTTQYDLRYKLKRGNVLRYEVTHRASIRSTIDETTQAAQTKTDSVKVWKVTDVLRNGEIEIMNVVERVHMVNQLPDDKGAEYDSTRDMTPPPGFEDAARSVGVPLSVMRISPRGEVIRHESKIRAQEIGKDTPLATRLPDKPVAIGETWDEPFELQVTLEDGSQQPIKTRRHFKLVSVESGIATIEVTYQVLSPMDAQIECQLVQRLMEGEVRFDIKAGCVVSQQMNVDRRILGFAGPTSSMQYVMRMEEKLLTSGGKVTGKSVRKTTASHGDTNRTPPTRTANRPRSQQGTRR